MKDFGFAIFGKIVEENVTHVTVFLAAVPENFGTHRWQDNEIQDLPGQKWPGKFFRNLVIGLGHWLQLRSVEGRTASTTAAKTENNNF